MSRLRQRGRVVAMVSNIRDVKSKVSVTPPTSQTSRPYLVTLLSLDIQTPKLRRYLKHPKHQRKKKKKSQEV